MKFIITILIFFCLQVACLARTVPITVENNTPIKKTVWVKWLNHPHGCGVFMGRLMCDFNIFVGEIKPGATFDLEVKDSPNTTWGEVNGRKYCAEWDNTAIHERKEGTETEQCFEIKQNVESIKVTPNSVTIKLKEKKKL